MIDIFPSQIFQQGNFVVYFVVLLVLIIFCWLVSRWQYFGKQFVIKVDPANVKLLKGSVPQRFLSEAALISKHNKVRGLIFGIDSQNGLALRFSKGVSDANAQRFRNTFPFNAYCSGSPPDDNGLARKR